MSRIMLTLGLLLLAASSQATELVGPAPPENDKAEAARPAAPAESIVTADGTPILLVESPLWTLFKNLGVEFEVEAAPVGPRYADLVPAAAPTKQNAAQTGEGKSCAIEPRPIAPSPGGLYTIGPYSFGPAATGTATTGACAGAECCRILAGFQWPNLSATANAAPSCQTNACATKECPANASAINACAANPCAIDACANNACATKACATNACATSGCATNACAASGCATNACATNACATNACAASGCGENPCGARSRSGCPAGCCPSGNSLAAAPYYSTPFVPNPSFQFYGPPEGAWSGPQWSAPQWSAPQWSGPHPNLPPARTFTVDGPFPFVETHLTPAGFPLLPVSAESSGCGCGAACACGTQSSDKLAKVRAKLAAAQATLEAQKEAHGEKLELIGEMYNARERALDEKLDFISELIESREQSHLEKMELVEALVESKIETAKLATQLEMTHQMQEVREQLAEAREQASQARSLAERQLQRAEQLERQNGELEQLARQLRQRLEAPVTADSHYRPRPSNGYTPLKR